MVHNGQLQPWFLAHQSRESLLLLHLLQFALDYLVRL
jgi:hypothetical protein